jgi:ubiquinone/menaquinone biosynthesis C-methylase UbiE
MPWRGWSNAEIYDGFVRQHRIYRELNRRIVDVARLSGARRVLDLGCGTGATALSCLRVLDPDADLVGVDASEEMIEVARANILDPRARFVVAGASAFERQVEGPFDRVVCNAAFWQFPAPSPVFRSVAAVTGPGARFVFNVPSERVRGERPQIHPFQVALARSIEARTGRRLATSPTQLDLDALRDAARESGFEAAPTVERVDVRSRQGELIELMTIPAMIRPLAPELDDHGRAEVVEDARRHVDEDEEVVIPWLYLAFERVADAPTG